MTNLKTKKSHFAKSKILLIVLCIFGLAFSYSCSCRDDNPYQPDNPEINNNGLNGGLDNGQGGKVYTPSVELSTNFMVVNSRGDGMKTTISAINLKNATVKSVSLNNQNITLEHKDGVISITKGFEQITTSKKAFELTIEFGNHADATEKDTLSTPNKKFNIEIIKATKITIDDKIGKLFQPDDPDFQFLKGNHQFNFKLAKKWDKANFKLELQDNHNDRDTLGQDVSVGTFKKDVEKLWQTKSPEYTNCCDGVTWTDAQGAGTPTLTVYLKFKFKAEIEVDNPNQEYEIVAPLGGKGKWVN